MAINWNDVLEDSIIGRVIGALLDEGFRIEISDQDGGGLFVYGVPDGGEKPKTGFDYWVRLVRGNGVDVIVDYTTNLEVVLASVNLFIDNFRD